MSGVVVALAFVGPEDRALTPSEEPLLSPAGSRLDDGRQAGVLKPTWAAGERITSGSLEGRVTAVIVGPEDDLDLADPVIEIDGIVRFAHVGERSFWRPIRVGDSGGDVVMLDELLLALIGSSTLDDDGRASESTYAAIRQMHRIAGRSSADGVFRPSDVLFVPSGSGLIGSVAVDVGEYLGQDELVAIGQPTLVDFDLELAGPIERRRIVSDTTLLITVDDEPVPVDMRRIDKATLAALAEHIDPGDDSERVDVWVARAEPLEVATIPSEAIVSDDSGSCIFVGDQFEPVGVDDNVLRSGTAGVAYVDSELVGKLILVNPALSNLPLRCGS